MIHYTARLRDALIKCEVKEMPNTFAQDDQEGVARYLIASLTALTSIPLGSDLEVSDEEVDGDVPIGPTGDWVDQLVQYYYGNSAYAIELMKEK